MEDFPVSAFVQMSAIQVPARLRPIDQAWVATLAASLEDHGLEQPITVRPTVDLTGYILVAGAHRHAAAASLGWGDIACIVRELDDDEARIVEIDENLMRHELNALDRGFFLLERKAVYERVNPQTRHGGDRRSKVDQIKSPTWRLGSERFTAEVADKVGLSERTVQRAIDMASKLDREAVACLRGTSMANNQSALLKLSQEPPAKQRTLAAAIRDGKAKTIAAAKVQAGFEPATVDDPQARYLATLLETWVKADATTRASFLADIKAVLASAPKGRP